MHAPALTPPVTLYGRDRCSRTDELRALLDALAVPFAYVPLDGLDPADAVTPDDPCGYVSPALRIDGGRGPATLLVQPAPPDTLAALRDAGLLAAARRRWPRRAADGAPALAACAAPALAVTPAAPAAAA